MGKPNKRQNQKNSVNPNKQQRLANAKIEEQQRIAKTELEKQTTLQDCQESSLNLQFIAMDTWFFRESRPHDAVGASELCSLFPPPVRTLIGAVRSFLGEKIGVNWQAFNNGDGHAHTLADLDFKQAIGNGENLGALSVYGPWVCKNYERLYPAPCYLMHNNKDFTRLQIGDTVECDLGNVRLPELPDGKVGYKGLEQTWITGDGWRELLAGKIPTNNDIIKQKDLFRNEARLGIARNNASRSAIEGKRYQTQHLRLEDDVTIELDVKELDEKLLEKLPQQGNEILRLGGEGRMAVLENKSRYLPLPRLIAPQQLLKKIIIHFVTPAYFGEQDFKGQMFPENFVEETENGQTIWQGDINGIKLIVESAVIGKVHREGGWDMQKHQPRAVKSYIPAGSAWFCRVDTKISNKDLLDKLHGQCIGAETEWGRGQILIGLWNDNTN